MSRYPLSKLTALVTSALAGGALLLSLAPAIASAQPPPSEPPPSGDPRATSYSGNIQLGDCAGAGLAGSQISVTSTIEGAYITITAVPEGFTLTGVVVKGGDGYNVYVGDVRDALHAPLNPNGQPAGISHWFACGEQTTTTTQTTTSTSETTISETTTSGTVGGGEVDETALAATGFSARGSLLAAGGLLLLGAGLVLAARRRALGAR